MTTVIGLLSSKIPPGTNLVLPKNVSGFAPSFFQSNFTNVASIQFPTSSTPLTIPPGATFPPNVEIKLTQAQYDTIIATNPTAFVNLSQPVKDPVTGVVSVPPTGGSTTASNTTQPFNTTLPPPTTQPPTTAPPTTQPPTTQPPTTAPPTTQPPTTEAPTTQPLNAGPNNTTVAPYYTTRPPNILRIPANVTQIDNGQYVNTNYTEIIFEEPSLCTSIGLSAFQASIRLARVTLPSSLQIIYTGAFDGCTSLRNVYVPPNVTTIENYAFRNCTDANIVYKVGSTVGTDAFLNVKSVTTYSVTTTSPTAPFQMQRPYTVAGDGKVTLSWSEPYDSGSRITKYTIRNVTDNIFYDAPYQSSSYIWTPLTNGIEYTFTITATNGVGTSSESAFSDAVTPAPILNGIIDGIIYSDSNITGVSPPGLPNNRIITIPYGALSINDSALANTSVGDATYYLPRSIVRIEGFAFDSQCRNTIHVYDNNNLYTNRNNWNQASDGGINTVILRTS